MSAEITICLISCGELTERDCLQAIEPHIGKFVMQEVRNVFPQIAALKKMTEQVETDYLIPLDADIVLYQDAWERIRFAVDKHHHDLSWHSILFPLFDTLTQRKILSLKILRTSILKQIPFEESATPDVLHYKRLTDAGYSSINRYLDRPPIGDHIVKGKHFCYHKYKDVYQTLKVHGWEWDSGVFLGGNTILEKAEKHFGYFLSRYLMTGNRDYLYCIAGMLDGIQSSTKNASKTLEDKTYHIDENYPIHDFVTWHMNTLRQYANSILF